MLVHGRWGHYRSIFLRDWGKPRKCVTIGGLRDDICTRNLSNTKQECQLLNSDHSCPNEVFAMFFFPEFCETHSLLNDIKCFTGLVVRPEQDALWPLNCTWGSRIPAQHRWPAALHILKATSAPCSIWLFNNSPKTEVKTSWLLIIFQLSSIQGGYGFGQGGNYYNRATYSVWLRNYLE